MMAVFEQGFDLALRELLNLIEKARHDLQFSGVPPEFVHSRGQLGDGRRVKKILNGKIDFEQSPHLGNHLNREQGVSAQLEEVIVYTNGRDTKHILPEACQSLFSLRT